MFNGDQLLGPVPTLFVEDPEVSTQSLIIYVFHHEKEIKITHTDYAEP
jgi:hypothetical protein